MPPYLFLDPFPDIAEASPGVADSEIINPTSHNRIYLRYQFADVLGFVVLAYLRDILRELLSGFHCRLHIRPPPPVVTHHLPESEPEKIETFAFAEVNHLALFLVDLDFDFPEFILDGSGCGLDHPFIDIMVVYKDDEVIRESRVLRQNIGPVGSRAFQFFESIVQSVQVDVGQKG